jgi:SAM-dependent methyltransferase
VEAEQYDLMFQQEDRHWWYLGMRQIVAALLDRYFHPATTRPEILDAGCGSGGATAWLARWGRVSGVDLEPQALHYAARREVKRLAVASIEALPFAGESFDLVTSFDVLYHLNVGNDLAALGEVERVLRPGGMALIRAPAHDWLRGAHDHAVHTRHRYHRDEMKAKLEAVGLRVQHTSYANTILFPLAPAKRLLEKKDPAGCVDLWQPPRPVNALLRALLGSEAGLVARAGMPWGLSVIAVAYKSDRQRAPAGQAVQPDRASTAVAGAGRQV